MPTLQEQDSPCTKQLEKADKRFKELDRLFIRLYEDNVAGKLSDDRFASMSRNYEDEQETLKEEMEILREEIAQQEQQMENLEPIWWVLFLWMN